MKLKVRVAVLCASVLVVLAGGYAIRASSDDPPAHGTPPLPLVEASVTVPDGQDPVVVPGGAATNTQGLTQAAGAAVHSTQDLRPEVLNAYLKAVAVAPAACHLSVSLLAAIGQVESGNLAGRSIDAHNRVVPAILGPVLDGGHYAAVKDTDGGRWDGNDHWDRALGPLQFVPASWRVVGLDLDDDGVRDPQDIFDAAGAAMVYLCASGRDLDTKADLEAAVMSYNHSARYLQLVLSWKAVFDKADLTGLESALGGGSWAMPALPAETVLSNAAAASAGTVKGAGTTTSARSHGGTSTKTPGSAATSTPTAPAGPTTPTASASQDAQPSTSSDPSTIPSVDPTSTPDPTLTCLPDPSGSALPGEGVPSVVPTVVPSVVPSFVPGIPGLPGDGTVLDPCALPTPSASAEAAQVD